MTCFIVALEINCEHSVPIRLRDLDQAADLGNTDVVVEHVDVVVSADTCLNHRLDVSGLAGVSPMRHGFSAFALNDPNGFLGGRQVDVSTKYLRAFACKRDRRCLAVAPARANRPGADNKCYLAFEPISDCQRSGCAASNPSNNSTPHRWEWSWRAPNNAASKFLILVPDAGSVPSWIDP
jgi:hypothetical protein